MALLYGKAISILLSFLFRFLILIMVLFVLIRKQLPIKIHLKALKRSNEIIFEENVTFKRRWKEGQITYATKLMNTETFL